jgi:hypothetical protein
MAGKRWAQPRIWLKGHTPAHIRRQHMGRIAVGNPGSCYRPDGPSPAARTREVGAKPAGSEPRTTCTPAEQDASAGTFRRISVAWPEADETVLYTIYSYEGRVNLSSSVFATKHSWGNTGREKGRLAVPRGNPETPVSVGGRERPSHDDRLTGEIIARYSSAYRRLSIAEF